MTGWGSHNRPIPVLGPKRPLLYLPILKPAAFNLLHSDFSLTKLSLLLSLGDLGEASNHEIHDFVSSEACLFALSRLPLDSSCSGERRTLFENGERGVVIFDVKPVAWSGVGVERIVEKDGI